MSAPIKKYLSMRQHLRKQIEISNVRSQDHKAKFLCLQKQGAVVKGTKPLIRRVALQAAQDSVQQGSPSECFCVRNENPMYRHRLDVLTDAEDRLVRAVVQRVESTDRMHQFLNGDC